MSAPDEIIASVCYCTAYDDAHVHILRDALFNADSQWNAAIEKAAEVAEDADRELSPEEFAKDYLRGYTDGAADVAAAIRALKRGKP